MVSASVVSWVIEGLLDRVTSHRNMGKQHTCKKRTKTRPAVRNADDIISNALHDAQLNRKLNRNGQFHKIPPIQHSQASYQALAIPSHEENQSVTLWRKENQYRTSMSKLKLHL